MKKTLLLLCLLPIVLMVLAFAVFVGVTAAPVPAATATLDPDAYDKGMDAYQQRDYQNALFYLKQVQPSHPEYSRAMRYIGWEIYTEELGQPKEGVSWVNRSLLSDPLEGNVWQDLSRTYGGLIGLEL